MPPNPAVYRLVTTGSRRTVRRVSRFPRSGRPTHRRHPRWRWALVLLTVLGIVVTGLLTAAGTAEPSTTGANRPGGPLRVVGIGDSVTAGTACDCVDFVRLYARELNSRGTPATASNLGIPGLTSAQLLEAVQRPGTLRETVAAGDVLLVTIGANDLEPQLAQWSSGGCPASCWSPAVARVAGNVADLVRAARSLHGASQQVLVTGYWNVFDDGDEAATARGTAYLAWSDALSRALNSALCDAALRTGATCVDLYSPFKGDGSRNPTSLLAADGDHPNAAGHRLIAGALLAASGR